MQGARLKSLFFRAVRKWSLFTDFNLGLKGIRTNEILSLCSKCDLVPKPDSNEKAPMSCKLP